MGHEGVTTVSLQIGESLFEVAALLIMIEAPLLEWFFNIQMTISPRKIRKAMAAKEPMSGHFILSKSDVVAAGEVGS